MRQAIMTAPGVIEYRDVPVPTPGPGQVALRILRIGICGSDIHVYHGTHPFTGYPIVQGHEYSAIVDAIGPDVTSVKVGQMVTATPQEVCGVCRPCQRGQYNVCENLKVRGFQAPGVAQDVYITEVDKLVPFPASFTPEQGAFVEPVAVAAHSTGRAPNIKGQNVVVLGAGTIGNFVAQACKARGAKKVLITDLSDFRLGVAASVGINAVSNPKQETLKDASQRVFGDEGFDIAFEAAAAEPCMNDAIKAIGKGGTIVVVGVFGKRPALDMANMGEHEISLVGTMMYRHEDYSQAVEWIAKGLIKTEPLDTKHYPFEQFLDAYHFIESAGDTSLKVFVDLV